MQIKMHSSSSHFPLSFSDRKREIWGGSFLSSASIFKCQKIWLQIDQFDEIFIHVTYSQSTNCLRVDQSIESLIFKKTYQIDKLEFQCIAKHGPYLQLFRHTKCNPPNLLWPKVNCKLGWNGHVLTQEPSVC